MSETTTAIEVPPRLAARLTLTGRVQGVGMRPAVARYAAQLTLTGYVRNTHAGVEIHVEGTAAKVRQFEQDLLARFPVAADVMALDRAQVEPFGFETFHVGRAANLPTEETHRGGSASRLNLATQVPPDLVACDACLAEVKTPADRRHDYPFTSCTDCGPRYSLIERMPYERPQTGMSEFSLCDSCRREYDSPADRRFHAQANACPDCGPRIWLRNLDRVLASGEDALDAAATAIRAGHIVALRGLGGYQLLVDATSQAAVQRLRERKRRQGKPLAVMVASQEAAARLGQFDETERRLLGSPAGPIVVVQARAESPLADSVQAGLNTIGLLLPTTPLHWLLLNAVQRPLVCTSGNRDAEPLVYQTDAALAQLHHVADVWLDHDRPIRRPIDDSVVRVMAGQPVALRLARGYAPLPLEIGIATPLGAERSSQAADATLLALGGHQKNSLALSNGGQAVLGPHIGDLASLAAGQRFDEQVNAFVELYGSEIGRLVCDLHPEYFTTRWAENQLGTPASRAQSVEQVQHHHAHIAAGMLEHGWLDRHVLGVAFDGTGYGPDGTIWGGEFLLCTATTFERVGHLRPFHLVGGERAVREPWRVATALVREAAGDQQAARLVFPTADAASLLPVLRRPALSTLTTSAGRLFDGVAALVLGVERCQFEGQAAMLLEAACDVSATGRYELSLKNGQPHQLDWRPLVRHLLRDRAAGVPPGTLAMRFHRGLASAIHVVCRRYSTLPVILGGGVFQNRVLVELLAASFAETRQLLGLPGLIPPNDGGLAAGQLAIAAARQRRSRPCV